jgi:DNA-directed RNA polymerase specialized sigma24 family protein
VEALLRAHYPRVCRIASALCGRKSASQHVVRAVMKLSIHFLIDWENARDAENWFEHHTVLASRLEEPSPVLPQEDCLVQHANGPSPEYVAFVKALRNLTAQQREAFILVRCEQLDPRKVAVAMDCSTAAAANHLIAANQFLSKIVGNHFDALTEKLTGVYASLTPPEKLIVGPISAAVRRATAKRWRKRILRILSLIVLGLLAWTVWRISRMIEI